MMVSSLLGCKDCGLIVRTFCSWYSISQLENEDELSKGSSMNKCLWVNRSTGEVLESSETLADEECSSETVVDALLGMLHFSGSFYLVIVTESELVADVFLDMATCSDRKRSRIYLVKSVKCLALEEQPVASRQDSIKSSVASEDASDLCETYDVRSSIGVRAINTATQWLSQHLKSAASKDVNNAAQQYINSKMRHIQGVERILCTGYYYSNDTDLTSSLQRLWNGGFLPLSVRRVTTSEDIDEMPVENGSGRGNKELLTLFDVCDENFNWAGSFSMNIPKTWVSVLIQGYVGYTITSEGGKCIELLLIGRRSVLRSGSRLNARGIDEFGNVGNFTESELRVRVDGGHWKSFVQVRGSVPVFWGQSFITSPPVLTGPGHFSSKAFILHNQILREIYGPDAEICYVNLLDVKDTEQLLTGALEEQLRIQRDLNITLVNFNFNVQVKWTKLMQELLDFVKLNLSPVLRRIGHFDTETLPPKVHGLAVFQTLNKNGLALRKSEHAEKRFSQSGIIRTNCLDCLDRTNAVQWIIAWVWLANILDPDGNTDMLDGEQEESELLRLFRDMWCAHGDAISFHYSGTASIYTAHIKQGRATLGGAFHYAKTLVDRVCIYMFEDDARQESFDLILGTHKKTGALPSIQDHVKDVVTPTDATPRDELVIWCGSWNLGGSKIFGNDDLGEWLDTGNIEADFYVFFIQEFVELTTIRVLMNKTDESKEILFNLKIGTILSRSNTYGSKTYVCIKSCSMIGLYLVIFAREDLKNSIKQIDVTSVKTGFSGNVGNKGAVGIKFSIWGYDLAFVNVHLNSGTVIPYLKVLKLNIHPGKTPIVGRMEQLYHIIRHAFQERESKNFYERDFFVMGGDFNFQIQLEHDQILEMIRRMDLSKILEYDEFRMGKITGPSFLKRLHEAEIRFQPTYKYKKGSRFYDLRRTPAWCDRVIYGGRLLGGEFKATVKSLLYTRHDCFYSSDHKPVSSIIRIKFALRNAEKHKLIDL